MAALAARAQLLEQLARPKVIVVTALTENSYEFGNSRRGQLDIEAAFVHAAPSGNNVECGTSCRAQAAAEKGISRQLRMLIPTPRFHRFQKANYGYVLLEF